MLFPNIFLPIGLVISVTVATPSMHNKRTDKFQFAGVSLSGPELQASTTSLPGVYGTDYTWFNLSTLDVFVAQWGMNAFRINILMERLVPESLTSPTMDPAYLGNLTETVEYITQKGAYAIITPVNGGRYYGDVINSTSDFEAFWKTVAGAFKDNEMVVFNANDGYCDLSTQLVVDLNQAAINGIRAAGATSQYITVEGNALSLAGLWTTGIASDGLTNAEAMGKLSDTGNALIYQVSTLSSSRTRMLPEKCKISPPDFRCRCPPSSIPVARASTARASIAQSARSASPTPQHGCRPMTNSASSVHTPVA